MTTQTDDLAEWQCELALTRVAQWMNWHYGGGDQTECVPTGEEAALHGKGPMLVMDWQFLPNDTRSPAIILEGLADWADFAWIAVGRELRELLGVELAVWGGYALLLYPAQDDVVLPS